VNHISRCYKFVTLLPVADPHTSRENEAGLPKEVGDLEVVRQEMSGVSGYAIFVAVLSLLPGLLCVGCYRNSRTLR
jgi:hypothetical protein